MKHDIPISHPNDLVFARRCLAADPGAVREFSQRYRPVAVAAVASLGFVGVDADEVLQRLFIRLLVAAGDRPAKLETYQGTGTLLGWVRICAIREALMERRAQRSRPERHGEMPVVADPEPHPEHSAAQADSQRELEGAFGRVVAGLDARERNLLRYSAYAGANQDQVARTYGVHRATVSRWFDRLRTKLRKRTLRTLADQAHLRGPSSPAELLPSHLDMHLSQVLGRSFEPEARAAAGRCSVLGAVGAR